MLPLPAAAKTRTGMNHVADLESEQWCHLMLWYLVLNDQTHHPVLSPTFSVADAIFSFSLLTCLPRSECDSCAEGHLACELSQAKTGICA